MRLPALLRLLLGLLLLAAQAAFVLTPASASGSVPVSGPAIRAEQAVPASALPAEARDTIRLIRIGGPFPYARDGSVFRNREALLPDKPRGYYREFTVPTPGLATRGARRIVAGSLGELYYTDDHYRSFRRITE